MVILIVALRSEICKKYSYGSLAEVRIADQFACKPSFQR